MPRIEDRVYPSWVQFIIREHRIAAATLNLEEEGLFHRIFTASVDGISIPAERRAASTVLRLDPRMYTRVVKSLYRKGVVEDSNGELVLSAAIKALDESRKLIKDKVNSAPQRYNVTPEVCQKSPRSLGEVGQTSGRSLGEFGEKVADLSNSFNRLGNVTSRSIVDVAVQEEDTDRNGSGYARTRGDVMYADWSDDDTDDAI